MLHTLGIAFIGIGISGFVLALALLAYATKKHSASWDDTARDTAGRAVLILIAGIIILICS